MKNTSSVDVKDKSLVDKDTIIKKYEALDFAENGMQMQDRKSTRLNSSH